MREEVPGLETPHYIQRRKNTTHMLNWTKSTRRSLIYLPQYDLLYIILGMVVFAWSQSDHRNGFLKALSLSSPSDCS